MLDYRQNTEQRDIGPCNSLAEDGWTVLEGTPLQTMRFDHGTLDDGPVVAIWECTPGKIHKDEQPFNEFLTLFAGEVEATLNGESLTLLPGDSFFVAKGDAITWDVKKTVRKYLIACGNGPLS